MGKGVVLLLAACGLWGCASQHDVLQVAAAGPDARQCDARIENQGALIDVFQDTRATALVTSNDGGWCGSYIQLVQVYRPFDWQVGMIEQPPTHGTVRLRKAASIVFVEYRAEPGYVGTDSFAVRFQPGYSIRPTTVQVVAAGPAIQPRAPVGITSSMPEELSRFAIH